MEYVCGYIRYNDEVLPVIREEDENIYFIDGTSNTRVYIEGEVPSSLLRLEESGAEQSELIASVMNSGGGRSVGAVFGSTIAGIRFTDSGTYECVCIRDLSPPIAKLASIYPDAPVDALAVLYFRARLYAGGGKVGAWAKAFIGTDGAAEKYEHTDYNDLLKLCGVDKNWFKEFAKN